jgi:hypothetical protein
MALDMTFSIMGWNGFGPFLSFGLVVSFIAHAETDDLDTEHFFATFLTDKWSSFL